MDKPVSFEIESPAWLRNLRWLGILFLGIALVSGHLAGAQIPLPRVAGLLAVFAIWNFFLPKIEDQIPLELQIFIALQVLVDLAVLSLLLWWGGGLANPFAGLFVLEILVAGLLLNPMLTVAAAGVASVAVVVLVFAPPLVIGGELLSLRNSPLWVAIPLGWIFLLAAATAFILVFFRRLGSAEDELRLQLKMEALSRLVAGLAHEVGTPLNSILLLAGEAQSEAPPRLAKDLRSIASQAKRCGETVSLLLGYSRTLVRSEADIEYAPVRAVDFINRIYSYVLAAEVRSPQRAPQFRVESLDLPEEVAIPGLVMQQVLENLLKNALYAVRHEPEPEIVVRIYRDLVEGSLVFEVIDNGPGFSEEGRERAFEAFFSTKTQELSPGLGLYMSYYLVSQVCGRIAVAEHSGRGAILRISLPRLEALDEQVATA